MPVLVSTKIDVVGIPRPGGSKTAAFNKKTGKGFCRPANPHTAEWRQDVLSSAIGQYQGELLVLPLTVHYDFRFPRPKTHYRSGKNSHMLKETAPDAHSTKPDLTKIIRSTEDALTGIVWRDDSQVCHADAFKRYCNTDEKPGVTITIAKMCY